MKYRAGEPPKSHYRADDRCFMSNGQWYFGTREGIDVGPYASREAAEFAIARLIKQLEGVADREEAIKVVRQFLLFI